MSMSVRTRSDRWWRFNKKATQLFIWMGEEIEGLDAAISLMHRLNQCMDKGGLGIERLVGLIESNYK